MSLNSIVRSMVKATLAKTFNQTPLLRGLRSIRRRAIGPTIHILAYHRVVEKLPDSSTPWTNPALCISSDSFRRQMEQVRNEFHVLSLADALAALKGQIGLDKDACVITFDDGYRDVILRADPILRALELPAATFVPTALAGASTYLLHDRLFAALSLATDGQSNGLAGLTELTDLLIRTLPDQSLRQTVEALEERFGPATLDEGAQVLSPTEIRSLAKSGWEIGSHTTEHVALTHESPERVKRELTESKAAIESWTEKPCRFFAYCNGLHDSNVVELLYQCGYEGAVTTLDRLNQYGADPMKLGRKTLWEGHVRSPLGNWSSDISAAHLHDLFGALGLTSPVEVRP